MWPSPGTLLQLAWPLSQPEGQKQNACTGKRQKRSRSDPKQLMAAAARQPYANTKQAHATSEDRAYLASMHSVLGPEHAEHDLAMWTQSTRLKKLS